MGFDFGSAINGGAEWVCRSDLGNRVIRNPIITALLITALCLIIIYAVYQGEFREAGWRRALRVGIYIGFCVTLLLFVHYYALRRSVEDEHAQKGVRSVVDSVHQNYSGAGAGAHKVNPGAVSFGSEGELPGYAAGPPGGAGLTGGNGYAPGRTDNVAAWHGAPAYSPGTGYAPAYSPGLDVTDAVLPSELGAYY